MNFGKKSLSTSAHSLRLKTKTLAIIAVSAFSLLALSAARADTIAGPSLPNNSGGFTYTGIGFSALTNSTLTSFTFQNRGQADTVGLYDGSGNLLESISTPSSTLSYTATVSWALTSGQQYYLLQSDLSNSKYVSYGGLAPSDSQIAMTETGIFGNSTTPSSFIISGTDYWTAFNNIQTGAPISTTPEPSSSILMLSAIPAMFWVVRRKRLVL